MALREKVPLSIVGLNADCLFEIFSHLKLRDVVNLRFQCSVLNDAVLKYILPTSKISIVYTEHEDPEEKLSPNSKLARFQLPSTSRQSFSQTVPTIRGLLTKTLEDCFPNPHFQGRDFIIISGVQNYVKFFEFVAKYLPNIRKLALIIDFYPSVYPVLSVASELLKACPKVETLFLERINRDEDRYTEHRVVFKIDDLGHLLITIAALPSLSELHFFARRSSEINLTPFNAQSQSSLGDLTQRMIGYFMVAMLRKLRIFRINYLHQQVVLWSSLWGENYILLYLEPLFGRNFENILELSFEIHGCLRITDSGTVFKNLQTLTLFGNKFHDFDSYSFRNSFQQLKTLQFSNRLMLNQKAMENLNALPNLEKLTAEQIWTAGYFEPEKRLNYMNDREEYKGVNKTIKHIVVKNVHKRSLNLNNYAFPDFFQSLLTVTVLLPEVTVYEPLRNPFMDNSFMDIEINHGS